MYLLLDTNTLFWGCWKFFFFFKAQKSTKSKNTHFKELPCTNDNEIMLKVLANDNINASGV